jgi:hypothetical protein
LVTRFVQRFNNSRRRLFHAETSGVFLSRFLFAPRRRVKKFCEILSIFQKFACRLGDPLLFYLKSSRFLLNVLPNVSFLRILRSLRRFDGGA